MINLGILSDIHYAGPAEQARGDDYEIRDLTNPLLRLLVRFHRHYYWLRQPLRQNHLLDRFLESANGLDYVIANGDYSCNSAFIGVSDDAACESARACLQKLRQKYGPALRATFGDHELGKLSAVGGRGGMRLASWDRARRDLGLEPFWQLALGKYLVLGVVSSLIALPVYMSETLPEERERWEQLRAEHLAQNRQAFAALPATHRVLLFCHDPTALPFLWREEIVRARLPQIEQTIIGHLHSNFILRQSRCLAGLPRINFLGNTVRRLSAALNEARHWQPFNVRLCPALAGIELLKDGGYYTAELDPDARQPLRFTFHPIPRT